MQPGRCGLCLPTLISRPSTASSFSLTSSAGSDAIQVRMSGIIISMASPTRSSATCRGRLRISSKRSVGCRQPRSTSCATMTRTYAATPTPSCAAVSTCAPPTCTDKSSNRLRWGWRWMSSALRMLSTFGVARCTFGWPFTTQPKSLSSWVRMLHPCLCRQRPSLETRSCR